MNWIVVIDDKIDKYTLIDKCKVKSINKPRTY